MFCFPNHFPLAIAGNSCHNPAVLGAVPVPAGLFVALAAAVNRPVKLAGQHQEVATAPPRAAKQLNLLISAPRVGAVARCLLAQAVGAVGPRGPGHAAA